MTETTTETTTTDDDLIAQALEQIGDAPVSDGADDDDGGDGDDGEPEPKPESESESESEGEADPKSDSDGEEKSADDQEGKPKDDQPKLSKAMARVARREANVLELETQIRQREESLTAREQQVENASRRWADLNELAKRDPAKFLQEAGIDIDTLAKQMVSGEAPPKQDPVVAEMRKEIEALKANQGKRQQEDEAYREQQRKAALQRHRRELESFVETKPEGVPFVTAIPAARAAAAMQEIVSEHWHRTKIILDGTEAARILNSRLEEHHKLLSQAAPQQPAAAPREQKGTKAPGTVTKSHRSRTAKVPGRDALSDEELVQAALDMPWPT